jgi:hypothetical protein
MCIKVPVISGQKFGRVTAIENGPDYVYPNNGKKKSGQHRERWLFECDCGHRFLCSPGTIRSNARYGWGCCSQCWACIVASGEPSNRQRFGLSVLTTTGCFVVRNDAPQRLGLVP